MKRNKTILLSIGLAYLIAAITMITKKSIISHKFFLIINVGSCFIALNELVRSIVLRQMNRINKTSNYLEKIGTKLFDRQYVKDNQEKTRKIIRMFERCIYTADIITYTTFFYTLLTLPYKNIQIEKINSINNITSVLCFALLFISTYINDMH